MGRDFSEFLEAVGEWLHERRKGIARLVALAVVIIAAPLAAFALMPTFLGMFAPPLDSSKDLYSVNRPLAFTFLDAEGHRGRPSRRDHRRAAASGTDAGLSSRRLHRDGRPPLLRTSRHRPARAHARALWTNFRAGHVVAGGSTITQQTAKIVFTQPGTHLQAQMAGAVGSGRSSRRRCRRQQILELYLNRIYLGSGAYGVDGAAHVYFNKSARDLTLPEAAMLATLTRAPIRVLAAARSCRRAGARRHRAARDGARPARSPQAQADDARAHPAVIADRAAMDARNYLSRHRRRRGDEACDHRRHGADRRPHRAHHAGSRASQEARAQPHRCTCCTASPAARRMRAKRRSW